jgi:hypothetical protein
MQVNKTSGDLYFLHTSGVGVERPANRMRRYTRAGAPLEAQTIAAPFDTFDGGGIAINVNGTRLWLATYSI